MAWLLGRWGGRGKGDYPTIEPFEYGQELVFTHDGRPFFHYFARSWIVDADGEKVRDAAQEAGFLRCRPGRQHGAAARALVRASPRSGTARPRAPSSSCTPPAWASPSRPRRSPSGKRLYGNVNSDLLYAYDMEAMGQPLQPHLWAQLERQ